MLRRNAKETHVSKPIVLNKLLSGPMRREKVTEEEAENWAGIPGSLLCLGQGYTQSQTSWLHLNGPEETPVTIRMSAWG